MATVRPRTHAMGHARPAHRGERTPSSRRHRTHRRRAQRDHRELSRAETRAGREGARVPVRDRHRGRRAPGPGGVEGRWAGGRRAAGHDSRAWIVRARAPLRRRIPTSWWPCATARPSSSGSATASTSSPATCPPSSPTPATSSSWTIARWSWSRRSGATFTLDRWHRPASTLPTRVTWDPVMAEKAGYKHFMLKEIVEQPHALRETILGRSRWTRRRRSSTRSASRPTISRRSTR